MYYLYGSQPRVPHKLVATFDSEPQLLAYVGWATLKKNRDGTARFEQGSALASCHAWEKSSKPLTDDDSTQVMHNPSPSML